MAEVSVWPGSSIWCSVSTWRGRWGGRWEGGARRRGRVYACADPCMAETNTSSESNYSPIRNKLKKNKTWQKWWNVTSNTRLQICNVVSSDLFSFTLLLTLRNASHHAAQWKGPRSREQHPAKTEALCPADYGEWIPRITRMNLEASAVPTQLSLRRRLKP